MSEPTTETRTVEDLLAENARLQRKVDSLKSELKRSDDEYEVAIDERGEAQQYAALLEAEICQCEPLCEDGSYLHTADCPVVEVQMRMAVTS